MIRCNWKMPDNDYIESGAQCVKYADHGSVHVIALATRGAVTFWQIKSRKKTVRMVIHADFRNGQIPSDDECLTLYHYLQSLKKAA